MDLSWSSVVARRIQRQGLATEAAGITRAVAAMGGAHAQVMSAAELSIGIRVADATTDSIRAALGPGGSLMKTYGPRGTVHLLPRAELPLWCAALSSVPTGSSLPEGVRLQPDQLDAVVDAIADSLVGSDQLDGDELGNAVVSRLGAWSDVRVVPAFGGWWPRWRLAIQVAAHRGVLAFGDNRGTRVTYINPHILPEIDSERALGWMLQRYLSTYGPATPEHYGRWLGVRKTWAASQFTHYDDDLQAVSVNGLSSFVNRGDAEMPSEPARGVRLLPHFDPYVIGSFPRELLFPGPAAARALGRGQAGVQPVLLVDGIVAGVWTAKRKAGRLELTVEPLLPLNRSRQAELGVVANRIGDFVGAEPEVTIGEVSTGAHM